MGEEERFTVIFDGCDDMWDILDNVFNELVEGKHFKTQEEAKAWCAFKNQGLVGRYQITPDGAGGFEIFDKGDARYIGERFHREVEAQAWASAKNGELHLGDDDYTYGAAPDDLELEAEMENDGRSTQTKRAMDYGRRISEARRSAGKVFTRQPLAPTSRNIKSQRIILDALAGKVKCSACGTKFHDPLGSFLEAEPLGRAPAIMVTRFIGHDSKNLTVDLTCNNCAHTGLYHFKDNPLLPPLRQ